MNRPIEIALCFDDHHALAGAVAILSLLATRTEPVRINVLTDPDPRADPLLRSVAARHGVEIRIIDTAQEKGHGFDSLSDYNRRSTATYRRIFLPDLLPDLDQVIYLDADVMVRTSLAPLWDMELGGAPVAAVSDPWMSTVPAVKEDFPGGYFNAGVLLLDLRSWREEGLTEICVAEIQRSQRLASADGSTVSASPYEQTPLNRVVKGRWKSVSPEWNFSPLLDYRLAAELGISEMALSEIAADPSIVHFLAAHKPWLPGFEAVTRWHAEYRRWADELTQNYDCTGLSWPSAFANSPDDARRRRMMALVLVQRAKALGFQAPVVVLTGLLGGEVVTVAREQGMAVAAFVALGPAQAGGYLHGLEILSLGEAIVQGHTDVILGDYRRMARTRSIVDDAAKAVGARLRILGMDASP